MIGLINLKLGQNLLSKYFNYELITRMSQSDRSDQPGGDQRVVIAMGRARKIDVTGLRGHGQKATPSHAQWPP